MPCVGWGDARRCRRAFAALPACFPSPCASRCGGDVSWRAGCVSKCPSDGEARRELWAPSISHLLWLGARGTVLVGIVTLLWPVMEHRAPNAAPLPTASPGQSRRKAGVLRGGSRRACPAVGGCTKEEKEPFPSIRHVLLFFSTAFGAEILSAAYVCAGTRPQPGSPRAPEPSRVPGLQQHLACPCRSPQPWGRVQLQLRGQRGHKHRPCSSPWAPLRGTLPPPQHPFSLSPPACFLGFLPYFSRWRQQPSLHLPSLSGSQLFFLLLSASCYPGAKNNKEFTALDLELGQAPTLCCVSKVFHGSSWVFLPSL